MVRAPPGVFGFHLHILNLEIFQHVTGVASNFAGRRETGGRDVPQMDMAHDGLLWSLSLRIVELFPGPDVEHLAALAVHDDVLVGNVLVKLARVGTQLKSDKMVVARNAAVAEGHIAYSGGLTAE